MTDRSSAPLPRPNTSGPRVGTLGFGCAGLYGLPRKRDRFAVLDAAYAAGIRHFDTAPMYGLGLAEAEMGEFMRTRADVRVATKFGIEPTRMGRMAGAAQGPIRAGLQHFSSLKAKVKRSGTSHSAGVVGRVLYTPHDYSVENARRSLLASRRNLGIDHIDYFFVHEPASQAWLGGAELADYLDTQQQRGVIGQWGPAGDLSVMSDDLSRLSKRASALQFGYDLVDGYSGPRPDGTRTTITFGFIAATLPILRSAFRADRSLHRTCAELIGADPADRRILIGLLVRNALASNPFGTVLLSSTNVSNVYEACGSVHDVLPQEDRVIELLRRECQRTMVSQ